MPVSTLAISSGAATAVRTVNGCIEKTSRQLPYVGQSSEHRRGGDHGGTHDVGERAAALAAFVIAVGGRGAAPRGGRPVRVSSRCTSSSRNRAIRGRRR